MTRRFAALALTGALALAGCGDEAADSADQVRTDAEGVVEQGREAVDGLAPTDAVRETRELVDEVGQSAEELAQDPDADVDAELADAEQRARDLADRAERELGGEQRELGRALGDVNDRLAETASDLQQVTDPQEARRVAEEDLGRVADELRAAVDQQVPDDVRRELEQARDRIDELQRELPSPGG